MRGGGFVLAGALIVASAITESRATNNDGEACTQDTECDSRACEVDRICRGSSCEKDDGCREGWTCLRRSNVLGATSGVCVPGCGSCPDGRACQDGGTECLAVQATVTVAIVEPPERNNTVSANQPVKLRADVKTTGRTPDLTVSWKIYRLGTNESPVDLTGNETTFTFTTPGQYQVDVAATSSTAVDDDSIGVEVK